jgi:phosphoenolpyruvate carboxylase
VNGAAEPYRGLLREVRRRLHATREWIETALEAGRSVSAPPDIYLDTEALAEPLRLCHQSLVATGNGVIGSGRLTDVLRRAPRLACRWCASMFVRKRTGILKHSMRLPVR